jgi:SAM-dependent methyltransferase
MGRRGVRVEDADRWVFNRLAAAYRERPGYPPELIGRLAELAGVPQASEDRSALSATSSPTPGAPGGGVAVDLGAGTGLISVPLAARGLRVFAVEPAAAMLRELERAAACGVTPVHAPAEHTGLPDGVADLAVLADALQWVDPGAAGLEIARLVRTGGVVAVIEARPAATPFMQGVFALVETSNFKARRSRGADARREQLIREAGGRAIRTELFEHEELLSPERLDAVLRSLSLVGPALGERAVEHLTSEVRALAGAHGGAVWARELTLTWSSRS